MTNQPAAAAAASTNTSSTGTTMAAAEDARSCVAAAALAQKGGCSGARHAHCTPPSAPSVHVPPFWHGQMRGSGRGGSIAVEV